MYKNIIDILVYDTYNNDSRYITGAKTSRAAKECQDEITAGSTETGRVETGRYLNIYVFWTKLASSYEDKQC